MADDQFPTFERKSIETTRIPQNKNMIKYQSKEFIENPYLDKKNDYECLVIRADYDK